MWPVEFDNEFLTEFDTYDMVVQDKILALVEVLRIYGPDLGRPYADTLAGTKIKNLKELRANVAGRAWRVAYAFDHQRQAILLCAGTRDGIS